MNGLKNFFGELKNHSHKRMLGGLDFFRYIGPGLLVTVGFIDPGNWASNFAAGSQFAAQRGAPRHRHRIVPVGSCHKVCTTMGFTPSIGISSDSLHLHFTCRDFRRCNST